MEIEGSPKENAKKKDKRLSKEIKKKQNEEDLLHKGVGSIELDKNKSKKEINDAKRLDRKEKEKKKKEREQYLLKYSQSPSNSRVQRTSTDEIVVNPIQISYSNEDSIPEELICVICFLPLQEPAEHELVGNNAVCSQVYCYNCVKELKQCPNCRNNVIWKRVAITPTSQKYLFNPLNDLKAVCPHCKNVFSRGDLLAHIQKCEADPKRIEKRGSTTIDISGSESEAEDSEEKKEKNEKKQLESPRKTPQQETKNKSALLYEKWVIEKEGYLELKGQITHHWKTYYAILEKKKEFRLYKHKEDFMKPKLTVGLENASIYSNVEKHGKLRPDFFNIRVVLANGTPKDYLLRAKSEDEKFEWVKTLKSNVFTTIEKEMTTKTLTRKSLYGL